MTRARLTLLAAWVAFVGGALIANYIPPLLYLGVLLALAGFAFLLISATSLLRIQRAKHYRAI